MRSRFRHPHRHKPQTQISMKLSSFDPPGMLTDFTGIPHQLEAWSDFVGQEFNDAVQRVETEVGGGNSPYYNPMLVSTENPVLKTIRWKGFPLVIKGKHPGNVQAAWKEADKLPGSA